jgi:hypothetical protein
MKNLITVVVIAWLFISAQSPSPGYYELRIYHLADDADAQRVEAYLEKALVPALHRLGIKSVGVFKPVKEDTVFKNRIYVFIPYKSLGDFDKLGELLQKDEQYLSAGSDYINASHTDPPYVRMETVLMKAFKYMPSPAVPSLKSAKAERVYELRSYEGATEKLYRSKVHMFNEGNEIKLFTKLNFNAVFYAEVLSGSRMPNLVYMTSFENKADRDAHWKAFVDDPDWKAMSSLQQYKNTVSHIDIYFLYPTPYSDF